MKIAVIAPSEIPARRANTVQVMKMAQALAACGHDSRLAAPRPGSSAEPGADWEDLSRLYGLQRRFPVTWLEARPAWRRYDYGLAAVRWARSWGAGLLYTRLLQAAALSSISGLPTVLELHDAPPGGAASLLVRLFLLGRGARRLVIITRALHEHLAHQFVLPSRTGFCLVAPDGVDLERYQGLPKSGLARRELLARDGLALPETGFVAGYTGHLYAGRGTGLLLELAHRLPEVTFLLVGGEPVDLERLGIEAARQGLANLHLVGYVPNQALPLYQAACDVLLMPYQRKVAASSGGNIAAYLSPMKLFEYMASGKPILSSDLPVLREVLHSGNSHLLPGDEAGAWEQALRELRTHPEFGAALGQQARREAAQYAWERRAENILFGLDQR